MAVDIDKSVLCFQLLNNGQGEIPEGAYDQAGTRYLPPSLVRLDQRIAAQNQTEQSNP